MASLSRKSYSLPLFIILSCTVHLAGVYFMDYFRPYDLRSAVLRERVLNVSLEVPPDRIDRPVLPHKYLNSTQRINVDQKSHPGHKNPEGSPKTLIQRKIEQKSNADSPPSEPVQPVKAVTEQKDIVQMSENASGKNNADEPVFTSVPIPRVKEMEKGPIRKSNEFVPLSSEKLTYRLMLLGIPAGTAVLEATNKNGEVRITTNITSNDVFSSIYPVEIFVDTRLVAGNYLLTRIKQHEGSNISDTGFTLMLREKNAFWVDRMKMRYLNTPLPSADVMDMISGFYYLRNRKLEVGKSEILHLFDSSKYVPTTVEVLRKEHLRLPGLREADTLVLHPILKSDGFFHSSGDIFVWVTDDDRKVPVKVAAQIPLGTVTADLVSSECGDDSQTVTGKAESDDSIQKNGNHPPATHVRKRKRAVHLSPFEMVGHGEF